MLSCARVECRAGSVTLGLFFVQFRRRGMIRLSAWSDSLDSEADLDFAVRKQVLFLEQKRGSKNS